MNRYLKVWLTTSGLTASSSLANRLTAGFFLAGKWLRLGMFIYFIVLLGGGVQKVAGFSPVDLITFFLIFNLFDLIGQLFFRGIYWFREQVISGEFDFRLIKPLNPLFQALTRQTDILDLPMLVIIMITLIIKHISTPIPQIFLFFLISICAVTIITAIHILVASLGVITTEVDHTIMIYRDISAMARFPIDIYHSGIRALLTFAIPIAVAFTYPAKAILGLLTPSSVILSFVISIVFFIISLKIWLYALTQYSSASS